MPAVNSQAWSPIFSNPHLIANFPGNKSSIHHFHPRDHSTQIYFFKNQIKNRAVKKMRKVPN